LHERIGAGNLTRSGNSRIAGQILKRAGKPRIVQIRFAVGRKHISTACTAALDHGGDLTMRARNSVRRHRITPTLAINSQWAMG
jgi:hypothetical protein